MDNMSFDMSKVKVGDEVILRDRSLGRVINILGDIIECSYPYKIQHGGNDCIFTVNKQGFRARDIQNSYDVVAIAEEQPKTEVALTNGTKMILSTDAVERKNTPIVSGVLDYFPLALAEVAKCSKAGNDQHNPNKHLHWDKTKSTDHADCMARHLIDRNAFDTDGIRHSVKLAWRALAYLQIQLEQIEKESNETFT